MTERTRSLRTHWHLYNVTVRTKAHPRELAPERLDIPGSLPGIADSRNQMTRIERGCPA